MFLFQVVFTLTEKTRSSDFLESRFNIFFLLPTVYGLLKLAEYYSYCNFTTK